VPAWIKEKIRYVWRNDNRLALYFFAGQDGMEWLCIIRAKRLIQPWFLTFRPTSINHTVFQIEQ